MLSSSVCARVEMRIANGYGMPSKSSTHLKPRVSHALRQYAGDAIPFIAEVFVFPHTQMLNAPAERLHLLAFSLASNITDRCELTSCLTEHCWEHAVLTALRQSIKDYRFIFRKLSVPEFHLNTYCALKTILDNTHVIKAFRLGSHVSETNILKLNTLPDCLRLPPLIKHLGTVDEAALYKMLLETLVDKYKVSKK